MDESKPEITSKPKKKPWVKWLAAVLIIAIIGGGGSGYYVYHKKSEQKAKNLATFVPQFDIYSGKAMKVSAKDGGTISVINEDGVRITISIPSLALSKDTTIGMVPLKSPRDLKTAPGVYLLPVSTVFNKPATLSFDFSASQIKNADAPKEPVKKLRVTGDAHIYRLNSVNFTAMPQLTARASETEDSLAAEVLGSGIFTYSLDGRNQIDTANSAFSAKKKNVLSIIEAATTLLSNKQKLTDSQIKLADGAVRRIAAAKNPNPIELYAAVQLNSLMHDKKLVIAESAKAAVLPGIFKYECKLTSHDPDQLYSLYKAAEAMGQSDGAESCMNTIRGIITKDTQKLLDQADPTYASLEAAFRDVLLFKIEGDYENAIKKKMRDKAYREAEDLLKDSKTGVAILIIARQNVQRYVHDDGGDLDQRLADRINGNFKVDVNKVIDNAYATVDDIAKAMEENEHNPNQAERDANHEKLEQKMGAKVRDEAVNALSDSNTTADDLLRLAEAARETGQTDLENLLKKKAADAPKSHNNNIEEGKDAPDREIPITDASEFQEEAQALESLGLKTFDQPGLNAWADDMKQQLDDAATMIMSQCGGGDLTCAIAAGFAKWFADGIHEYITDWAEEVGEVQARPDEQAEAYDGKNENDRISGSCIGKEQAATMQKSDADKYTLCPGVTKDDFDKKPPTDPNSMFKADGSLNEDYQGDFSKEKCLQQIPAGQYPDGYCDWIADMIQWQKEAEKTQAEETAKLQAMQAAAEAQAASQAAGWSAEDLKALEDWQNAASQMADPTAGSPSAPTPAAETVGPESAGGSSSDGQVEESDNSSSEVGQSDSGSQSDDTSNGSTNDSQDEE